MYDTPALFLFRFFALTFFSCFFFARMSEAMIITVVAWCGDDRNMFVDVGIPRFGIGFDAVKSHLGYHPPETSDCGTSRKCC